MSVIFPERATLYRYDKMELWCHIYMSSIAKQWLRIWCKVHFILINVEWTENVERWRWLWWRVDVNGVEAQEGTPFWSHWLWHPGHCHGQMIWVCQLVRVNNNQYITIEINNHLLGPYSRLWHNYESTGMHCPPDSAPSCVSCVVTAHEQLLSSYVDDHSLFKKFETGSI